MPRNIERDKREADRRKNQLIEAGFRLFSQNGIETVSLQKVADAANVSPATMYKYFLTKEKLLIAISAKVWDEVWQEALGDPGTNHFEHFTAYQGIEFYADRMIALYKNRPEVLRFSGEYKTYMNRRGNMEDYPCSASRATAHVPRLGHKKRWLWWIGWAAACRCTGWAATWNRRPHL